MKLEEIRKESMWAVEVEDKSLMDLAAAAQEVLGYSVLAKMTKKPEEDQPILTSLQTVLKELEIDILLSSDVSHYKKERLIEETVVRMKTWMKTAAEADSPSAFFGPDWHEDKIENYHQPVPEFVLAKAIQIKKAFPECQIFIESLRDNPDPFLLVTIPDPRSPYYTPKEKYYIEVWEEPKFEGMSRVRSHASIETDNIAF